MPALLPPIDGLSAELQRARCERGHTQARAAELMGVSLRTWQHWERGRTNGRPSARYESVLIWAYLAQIYADPEPRPLP